jgi:RNA polymerase sigma-70 factor (ECF subfamily)
MGNNEDLKTLVIKASRGDADAINTLYRLYEVRLKAAVKRKLGDKLKAKMEPADLVQSVWKDCLSDMEGFTYKGDDSFFQWLLLRILRKIQDKGRYFAAHKRDLDKERVFFADTKSRGVPPPAAADPTPSQVAMADEDLNRLMKLLDQLPDPQRQALVLRLRDNLEFEAIARIMDKTPGAVRKLYGRALKRIHELKGDSTG